MLPAPNLDDRAFQDLVDEAKRLVQRTCPEWTDHNVADPGVTLIETFAYMTDQLIYRLNRVPDLHYIKFLDLLGERMYPPAAAIAPVTFWLAVPQSASVLIPRGTEVSTVRRGQEAAITFTTDEDLDIVATKLAAVMTQSAAAPLQDRRRDLVKGSGFDVFTSEPVTGDSLYIGLSAAAPNCIVRLKLDCEIDGIGVDPLQPPLAIEAWDGHRWQPSEVLTDTTGGFNRRGEVQIYLEDHVRSTLKDVQAAWLRFRVIEPAPGQPAYTSSPRLKAIEAATIGGVSSSSHGRLIVNEIVGETSGVPGQRLQLGAFPLVARQGDLELEVSGDSGWTNWTRVQTFANSEPDSRHFMVDDVTGELSFGPAIRDEYGGIRNYGAVPRSGSTVRIPQYVVGGGRAGNVESGTLTLLRSSIPFVSRVENRIAAVGGVDAESLANVKERAAVTLHTRDRAVTASDYEMLTMRAAPSLARVRCVDAGELGSPGTLLVLVVPSVAAGVVPFELLQPRPEVLQSVRVFLDERRCLGSTVRVEPPRYLGVTVLARVRAKPAAAVQHVTRVASDALVKFLHPTRGGYDGTGWPFGRPLFIGDIHAVLQNVEAVAYVDQVRLVATDPVTGVRGKPTDRVEPAALELLFSGDHEIDVVP